ncbi:hypothetical protein IHV25_02435 [Phaeovibrio sulfidiphilus]|uniref:Uncharacterized protein n=1 Tax=Phaeovibrio sulfidiphilus TaxID=1220600 RepID=A0A8J6YU94_9PROT|nr:hypothetical protein [Phaeovibrio sulfidiphilus]MBE1236509.1 hypothetical protein [Phaeovibrio sulfidiphilus]
MHRINSIEDPWVCASVEDVYSLDSRMTISRVLKSYIEAGVVLPSEILHCYTPLSRLRDHNGNACARAIEAVVRSQCDREPERFGVRARREELYTWFDDVVERTRRYDSAGLPPGLDLTRFPELCDAVRRANLPAEAEITLARQAVAQALYRVRDFRRKLHILLLALEQNTVPAFEPVLDEFMSDILFLGAVVVEMLGNRANLAHAFFGILDLIDGRPDEFAIDPEEPSVRMLREAFRQGRLPVARRALFERFVREIGGRQPLSRNDPQIERALFSQLLARLVTGRGVRGGENMAIALTQRQSFRLEQGGLMGWTLSIPMVAGCLPSGMSRLRYIQSLVPARTEGRHIAACAKVVLDAVRLTDSPEEFFGDTALTPEGMAVTLDTVSRDVARLGFPEQIAGVHRHAFDSLRKRFGLRPPLELVPSVS